MLIGRASKCLVGTLGALAALALIPVGASAAIPAGKVDLTKITAKTEVNDAILPSGARIAATPRAVASATYSDAQGRNFSIDTTVPGYDLAPAAALLNSTYHKAEIAKLTVHAIALSAMNATCGDPQAIACYRPMSGGYGELWFGADDPDWQHSLVHEYGHHMDNQLANIAQLKSYGYGNGCTISSDGSRDWFFFRITASNTTDADRIYCNASDWEHLLPELYAEDFVVMNGIIGWQLSSAQPPNNDQLKAMKFDIDNKLTAWTASFNKKIKKKKTYWRRFSTSFFSLVRVSVKAPRGADFDVYVYPAKSNTLWSKSAKSGRKETYTDFVAPGTWDVGIYARKKTAKAKVEVKLR